MRSLGDSGRPLGPARATRADNYGGSLGGRDDVEQFNDGEFHVGGQWD